MRRGLAAGLLVLFAALPVQAGEDPAPRALAELDALRIKVLVLERAVIEERLGRQRAEAALQYADKARALDAAIEAAARKAGLALTDGWRPDVEAKVWRK